MTWILAGSLGCIAVATVAVTELDKALVRWWDNR